MFFRLLAATLFCICFLTNTSFAISQESLADAESEKYPVPRWFPDTSSGIHLASHQWYQTETSLKWTADHCDIIVWIGIQHDSVRRKFKQHNKKAILLAYMNAWQVQHVREDPNFLINPDVVAKHPEWILKKEGGGSVHVLRKEDWNVLIDPGNPDLREYMAKQAVYATDGKTNGYPQLQEIVTPYDGLFLDEPYASLQTYWMSTTDRPINPRTGRLYTENEWHNDVTGLVKHINDALKRRWPLDARKGYLVINSISPGYDGNNFLQRQQRDLLQFTDGTLLEDFVHGPWQKPDQWQVWERCISDVEFAESRGKCVIALTAAEGGDPPFHSRLHMYGLASYLLAKGKHSYFVFTRTLDFAGVLNDGIPYWWKGWSVDIGSPTAKRTKDPSGVWRRPYSNGLVLVNPADEVVITKLERKFYLLKEDGEISDKPIQEIRLPSRTGAILLISRK